MLTNDTVMLFLIPLAIAIIGLVIEYWIVQPLRAQKTSKQLSKNKRTQEVSLASYLGRLLVSFSTGSFNYNRASSNFIEGAGTLIATLPAILASSILSVVFTIIAIPLFIVLYFSEKVGECRFEPTCKEYLIQSFELHGPIKGFGMSIIRVSRCSPLFAGGEDPVPLVQELKTEAATLPPQYQFQRKNILRSLKIFFDAIFLGIVSGIIMYKLGIVWFAKLETVIT